VKTIVSLVLLLFGRKIFFVVKYFEINYFSKKNNNNFLENNFWCLARTKKLSIAKNYW